MIYKQHAEGDFTPTIVPETPHCGVDDSRGRFSYCVDVEYTSRGALDGNGFLIDNLDFKRFFDSLSEVSISCENLCEKACRHFADLLGSRIHFVRSICVKIHPFVGVWVEAHHTVN